jgi:acetyltransferase-like isoleucine patch superfamily enzyme
MSFVKKSLDEWGIYAGNPIKFIKSRKKGLLKFYNELTKRK